MFVYLFELKSTIKLERKGDKVIKDTLKDVIGKIGDTISRVYHLFLINRHNSNLYKNVNIKFKGIVFYNKEDITFIDNSKIYEIFKSKHREGLITVPTLLGDKKIKIQFIKNDSDSKNEFTVPISELDKF